VPVEKEKKDEDMVPQLLISFKLKNKMLTSDHFNNGKR